MAKLSPVFNDQTFTENGDPAVGYQLFTYAAGSSTKLATYSDEAGTIPNSNPIIINNDGFPTQGEIWQQEGSLYKYVLALPTDTDPPTSPVKTFDNIPGINDTSISVSQWLSSGVTPTYISATSFTLPGDQTSEFHPGRQLQLTVGSGIVYGYISTSVFASLTTVTMVMNQGQVLDNGLSTVNLSILSAVQQALPVIATKIGAINMKRSTLAATATTTPLWVSTNGGIQDWTGAPVITNFPLAPNAGAYRVAYPAVGTIITNAGSISVQGNANYIVASGDEITVTAVTENTFYVSINKKTGAPVLPQTPFLNGLQMSPAGGTTTMPVSAGSAVDSTNSLVMHLASAYTKTTATWVVGTGNGGKLSAAAMANDTWYHFFLIYRSDTGVADIGFDVSTTPTLPIGYTHYRRIFSALTNGSAQWLKIVQTGNNFDLDVPIINYNNITSQGAAAVTRVASVPTGIVVEAKLNMNLANSGTGSAMLVSSLAVADTAPSSGNSTLNVSFFSNSGASGQVRVMTNTSAQYRTRLTSGGADVSQSATTIGWIDTRGRDA